MAAGVCHEVIYGYYGYANALYTWGHSRHGIKKYSTVSLNYY